jgi:hypothetical protein
VSESSQLQAFLMYLPIAMITVVVLARVVERLLALATEEQTLTSGLMGTSPQDLVESF